MARFESLIEALDRSRKRIAIAFGLAILLHLPMTPVMPVLRLVHRWHASSNPAPVATVEAPPPEIEVELKQALHQEELRKEQPPPPESPKTMAMAPPPPAIKFASAAPKPDSEDGNKDKEKDPTKKDKVRDVGMEGIKDKDAKKPGLTLGLWLSSLRDNPLGTRLAELAACDREWKFFVDQGVDLLRDFDGALIVGPGLYEAKQITVAVRHALPSERVHEIMNGLVKQSGGSGKWLTEDVATARLGKVQRVLLPQQSDLFFVAPNKGWEALHKVKEPLKVPTSEGRLLSLVLAPPHKALERAGLTLPKRISELRIEVFANPDQSLDIRVELEDASPEAAERDVRAISRQLHDFFADVWSTAATLGALTGAGSRDAPPELAPRLDLSVEEKTLTGMIHLTPAQTQTTIDLASSVLCRRKHKGRR